MKTQQIRINADIARNLLKNNKSNRNVRPGVVKKYARDMMRGDWHSTHQGIAIYDDGQVADGQHRLLAIIESDAEIDMLVTFGIPREASLGIDQHAIRAAHDCIKIASGCNLSKSAVGVIRCLMVELQESQQYSVRPSATELYDYYVNHEKIIEYGSSFCDKKIRGITAAPVGACISAAMFQRENITKLERFCVVLAHGEINGAFENAAIRLREYLLFNKTAWHGGAARADSIKRTQRAIKAFCIDEPLSRLQTPKEIIYFAPSWN